MKLSRRGFITLSLTAAGSLLIRVPGARAAVPDSGERTSLLGGYIEITADNEIIVGAPNPEMGQGVGTALPMLIAEELGVDFDQVSVQKLPVEYVPGDEGLKPRFPGQGAGGSWSVVLQWEPMRKAGAAGRIVLLQAAADAWQVPMESVRVDGPFVVGPNGKRASFASLAEAAAKLTPPDDPALKSFDEHRVLGTGQKDVNAGRIVTGKVDYSLDQTLPGAVNAVVLHAPQFDAKPLAIDDVQAKDMPGYIGSYIIDRPEDLPTLLLPWRGVAVVAEKHWQALAAAKKVHVDWSPGSSPEETDGSLLEQARTLLDGDPTHPVRSEGDVQAAFAEADDTLSADYELPYVAHAPMEPQNCVADVRENSCTIIAPMQFPTSANYYIRDLLGLEADQVHVKVPRLGGGFGRRLTVDHVVEGVLLSRQLKRPVKTIWTRTEDLRNDYLRPGGVHRLKASIKDGAISGWQYHLASPTKYYQRANMPPEDLWKSEIFPDDFPAQLIPNLSLDWYEVKSSAFRGSWRAPASVASVFAVESFVDELAEQMQTDPLALRLKLLGDAEELPYEGHGGPVWSPARMAAVLKAAADAADWSKRSAQRPMGIAGHFTFGSYAAFVIELEAVKDRWRVGTCTGAIDCGQVVNTLGVTKQMEGGLVDGLSTALGLAIKVEAGGIRNENFGDYPLMRMPMAPRDTQIVVMNNANEPRGVGEPPIVPVAPALANAVFAATGKRMRKQPFLTHYPGIFAS